VNVREFNAEAPGKHLLVLGAVHGNEVCGPLAIRRIMDDLEKKSVTLQAGRLTVIPVVNERAHHQNVRYVEENLNRVFLRHARPQSYEAGLANQVIPHIEACDLLLDIHSFSAPGRPFVFQDVEAMGPFAAAMHFPIVMTGWPEIYAQAKDKNEGDTVGFALGLGKEAILVECGQHQEPGAEALAYQAILNAMAYAGLVDKPYEVAARTEFIHLRQVYFRDQDGAMARLWRHGDPVRKGETLATMGNGHALTAPEDGFVLLPHHTAKPGDEWFYFGVERNHKL